jgi:hypothetical protein
MKALLATLCACALVAAATSCNKGPATGSKRTEQVGGCTIETITIGTGMNTEAEAPADAAWIRVSSVEPSEYDVYKKAALDLAKALEMRNVEVYSRSELKHVAEGACWPPYSVEFKIKLNEQAGGPIHKFLQTTPLAEHLPTTDRPEGYGPFFVTCGSGSSDWWTVWYRR